MWAVNCSEDKVVCISKANLAIHHQNSHKTLLFQNCNHVSDCRVRCAVRTRSRDITVNVPTLQPACCPSHKCFPAMVLYLSWHKFFPSFLTWYMYIYKLVCSIGYVNYRH